MTDDFTPSGGAALVFGWLEELTTPAPGLVIWTALDDGLRLALTQGWMMGHAYDRAAPIVISRQSSSPTQPAHTRCFRSCSTTWSPTCEAYTKTSTGDRASLASPTSSGSTWNSSSSHQKISPELIPRGAQLPAHCFITKTRC
jgi:hypothetical protein